MRHSIKVGFNFGLTSGIITTMGLMVGLNSGTQSRLAVIGGILTIAVADAFSDAMGIHMSEEGEGKHTDRQVWQSTIATFVTKFLMALTFLVPVLLLPLSTAMVVSVVWGFLVLTLASWNVARHEKKKDSWIVILEHLGIGIAVVITTHYVGHLIAYFFGSV